MKIFFLSFAFLALVFHPPSAESATLTIKRFIELAEENDPSLKKILADEKKLRYILDAGLPSKEFSVKADYQKGFSKEDNNDTSVLTGSISKEFITSGTTVSVSRTETTQPDRKEEVTEFRIEQDVFSNFFGRNTRTLRDSLLLEEETIRLEVLESFESYIASILSKYLDYQRSYLDVELANIALKDALRLQTNVRQKRNKNIATQTDVDKASLQVLQRKEDLLQRQRTYDQFREEIGQIVGTEVLDKPSLRLFDLLFDFYKKSAKKSKSLEDLIMFKVARFKNEIADKELVIARRENLPEISLYAGYDIDNSERFSSTVNRKETIIGMSLSLPIWDTVQRAAVEEAVLKHEKASLDLEIDRRDLQTQQNVLLVKLREQEQKREIIAEKVRLSERVVRDEKRRYNFGRINLDDLISLESDYIRFKFQQQSEELDLGKSIIEWLSLNDQLLILRRSL